jgi:hypothetical protein
MATTKSQSVAVLGYMSGLVIAIPGQFFNSGILGLKKGSGFRHRNPGIAITSRNANPTENFFAMQRVSCEYSYEDFQKPTSKQLLPSHHH